MPAQKKPPAPVSTPTLSPSSASSSSSPAAIPSASGRLTALRASGRFSVMTRTLSRRSVRTAGCSVLMAGAYGAAGVRAPAGPRFPRLRATPPCPSSAATCLARRRRVLPGAAVGLFGVEFDDEVVVGPVAVDGEVADLADL